MFMKKSWTENIGLILFVGGILIALFFGFYDYLRGDINDDFGFAQKLGVWIGIGLFLVAGTYVIKNFWRSLSLSLFALGVFLLALNIYGEFITFRSPKISEGTVHFNKVRKPQKPLEEIFQEMDQSQDESNEEYASRLTDLVYSETIHKWEDVTDYTEYNHQVPAHENYFLWAKSYLNPNYRFYLFCDPYKAVERGAMICTQAAEAMTNQWRKMGKEARNVVLDGHIVAEVQVDREKDVWWVLDADLGVVLEYDMQTLQEQTDIAISRYRNAGYDLETATMIGEFYGKEGNYVQTNAGLCQAEQEIYRLKWYFPFQLLALSSLYFGWAWFKNVRLSGVE